MSNSEQLSLTCINDVLPLEDTLQTPDTSWEHLKLFDPSIPRKIWKTPLEQYSPVPNPLGIGSIEEDTRRFEVLSSAEDRRFYLFHIFDEISNMRSIRDTRIIYGVDHSIMSQLIGVDVTILQSWETPEICQNPESIIDKNGLLFDVMRLFVILDELGYRPLEIKELITRDIKDISKMIRKGGYQTFIKAVDEFLPYHDRERKL